MLSWYTYSYIKKSIEIFVEMFKEIYEKKIC